MCLLKVIVCKKILQYILFLNSSAHQLLSSHLLVLDKILALWLQQQKYNPTTPYHFHSFILDFVLISLCITILFQPFRLLFRKRTCASQTLTPQYYRALAALYYPIPTVVIVFSYGLIYWHIRSHFRRQQSHVSPPRGRNCTSPVSSLPPDSAFAGTNIQRRRCKAQNEIVSNIFFPILATITFSLPLCVTLAIGETNYIKFTITIYLCNLGVAPVVYGLRNPQLKVSIGRLLNWQCPQKPQGYYSTTVNMSNFSRNRYVEATIQQMHHRISTVGQDTQPLHLQRIFMFVNQYTSLTNTSINSLITLGEITCFMKHLTFFYFLF